MKHTVIVVAYKSDIIRSLSLLVFLIDSHLSNLMVAYDGARLCRDAILVELDANAIHPTAHIAIVGGVRCRNLR